MCLIRVGHAHFMLFVHFFSHWVPGLPNTSSVSGGIQALGIKDVDYQDDEIVLV